MLVVLFETHRSPICALWSVESPRGSSRTHLQEPSPCTCTPLLAVSCLIKFVDFAVSRFLRRWCLKRPYRQRNTVTLLVGEVGGVQDMYQASRVSCAHVEWNAHALVGRHVFKAKMLVHKVQDVQRLYPPHSSYVMHFVFEINSARLLQYGNT